MDIRKLPIDTLYHKLNNIEIEIENARTSLKFIPEKSILGRLSVEYTLKKLLQKQEDLKDEISFREFKENNQPKG